MKKRRRRKEEAGDKKGKEQKAGKKKIMMSLVMVLKTDIKEILWYLGYMQPSFNSWCRYNCGR